MADEKNFPFMGDLLLQNQKKGVNIHLNQHSLKKCSSKQREDPLPIRHNESVFLDVTSIWTIQK